MKNKLVDAHTHHYRPEHLQILVLDPLKISDNLPAIFPENKFCIGWHPWNADNFESLKLEQIMHTYMNDPNFVALGELGLDRYHASTKSETNHNWQKQLECFKWQLNFAIQNNIPRLVIHSLRAQSDILGIINSTLDSSTLDSKRGRSDRGSYQGKILWHDFNGNRQMIEQILKLQNIESYFSIGAKIFNPNTKIFNSIAYIPQDRLLLETDDQCRHSLEEIYEQCAKLLSLSKDKLINSTNHVFSRFLT